MKKVASFSLLSVFIITSFAIALFLSQNVFEVLLPFNYFSAFFIVLFSIMSVFTSLLVFNHVKKTNWAKWKIIIYSLVPSLMFFEKSNINFYLDYSVADWLLLFWYALVIAIFTNHFTLIDLFSRNFNFGAIPSLWVTLPLFMLSSIFVICSIIFFVFSWTISIKQRFFHKSDSFKNTIGFILVPWIYILSKTENN
ncbi:hypothetical protein J2Z62_000155 [Mycoplasmoides fastidiosum]|uniref:Uncharacterized protein n=1 Tax=Mycoplasmoides fastidiosum TaxID=92758 RepID=A0ABU0LYD2_9BACT|nr:hypothetical protein [Mycoplasmoides fastidiosum]MDQ0513717.1 hypothetical protein [Mycoplasmoides fastidiosum]UUD37860.1 hypothetical protein NPA10_00485 [Mycoplasmoides fastidiosum]